MHGTHPGGGGHTQQSGKVEIFDNNRWGGVCHKHFPNDASKDNFAKATCRTLGHLGGEQLEPKAEEGAIAQRKMECGENDQLQTCKKVGWQVIWFRKSAKGSPKQGSTEYSMWALKYASPHNNIQRALKDCLMMRGCFSIGQVVNDNSASLSQMSRYNRNSLSDYDDSQGFIANVEALGYRSGYCEVDNASFAGFRNRTMCRGGRRAWVAFRQTLTITDSANQFWHFSPRVDFGKGGVVTVGGEAVVESKDNMWQPNDQNAGKLDFTTQINGTVTIKIQGAENCCDGTQRLWQARTATAAQKPTMGRPMQTKGWRLATPQNIAKDIKDTDTSKDVYYFFVDKNISQGATTFSKQAPYQAFEEISRKDAAGTGAPDGQSNGNGITNMQTWTMIDHNDVNRATTKEFGYFLDGTSLTSQTPDWDANEPAEDKHFAQESKSGKWKTADNDTQFFCTTCQMGESQQRVLGNKQNFWGAFKACRGLGGDLPKKLSAQDKNALSQTIPACTGAIQSPQFVRRENFWRQASGDCKMAQVQCILRHTCPGCSTDPKGFGRLIDANGQVAVSYMPNEGFLQSENFSVTSSTGKETTRWDNNTTVNGYQVYFRPDETLSYAGPQSTFNLTWHQETTGDAVNSYKVHDFGANSGYSGKQDTPGRGTYWIWFAQDYFQKEVYGCKEVPVKGSDNEHFRCVFFARMFLPPLTGVIYSFTWVYMVSQNPKELISAGSLVSDSMQCKDPSNCPNSTTVDGLDIKAADQAKCGFTNGDDDEPALNPKVITAGTDIKVRCDWDSKSLEYGNVQKWEQGMDGYTLTSAAAKDIRTNGYPNNTHIKTQPFDCLLGMGRQSKEMTSDGKPMGWKKIEFTCDQQFNGIGTYHTLAMTFKLNKNISRRRLSGKTKGDEGTFGYNMRSGKCIKKDANDKSCAQYETKAGGETGKDFAFLVSLLALFALY